MAYLNIVKLSEGQFSTEYSVRVRDFQGEEFSGFFQKKHIKNGKLEVRVIGTKEGESLVKVPGRFLGGEAEVGSGCYLTVKSEEISEEISEDVS